MKILILGSRVPWPLHDGGAIATFNLLKGLSQQGIQVTFLSLNTKKHFVDEKTIQKAFPFLHYIQTCYVNTSISPWKAFINLFSKKSYNIQRFTINSFQNDIAQIIQNNDFDLVHFEGLFVSQYRKLLSFNGPTILRQHNIEYRIWETLAESIRFGPKRWYINHLAKKLKRFEMDVTHRFNAVISITETDRIDTVKNLYFKGDTICIPAGIELNEIQQNSINSNYIYHIGSMEWMPNIEAMQWFHERIWPQLKSKTSAKFFMAGKHMPDAYKDWQTERFIVAGEVENQADFIADKSILIVPLKSGSGIRIKTIEAMMAGKAVVTTSQGALGLPLVNGKHCLIADSSEALVEAMKLLLKDVDLRNKIADRGKQLALSYYGNLSVSKQWLAFYNSVLNKQE